MNVKLKTDFEDRLREIARQQAISVDELVNRIVKNFLEAAGDGPESWVQVSESQLAAIWPVEDFSDWRRPNDA